MMLGMIKALLVIFPACIGLTVAAGLTGGLSPEQLQALKSGQQVKQIEDISDSVWPRVSIYQTIAATPKQVMAVFTDYTNAKEYTPGVTSSEISKTISSQVKEVDYVVKVPFLADEHYTVRNTFKTLGSSSYRVSWTMVRSTYMKSSEGDFTVEPFNGGTLVRHRNLSSPASSLVTPLKAFALEQSSKTVASLKNLVETMKDTQPQQLDSLVTQFKTTIKKP